MHVASKVQKIYILVTIAIGNHVVIIFLGFIVGHQDLYFWKYFIIMEFEKIVCFFAIHVFYVVFN